MNTKEIASFIGNSWKKSVLSTLETYISIPNQSPDFDDAIHTNGHQENACKLLATWVEAQNVKGLSLRILHEDGHTPLIYIEVKAFLNEDKKSDFTVLMYGHFDKQPPLTEDWAADLHPHKPIIKDGKLYGRGGADDGYAIFAAVDSIRALQAQNVRHPRCCIVIEGSEESGSPDLLFYLQQLEQDIGPPRVVICLDSGCQNYEQLWMTVSLRGVMIAFLRTQLLKEGIHSGDSGLVRDSFHALRLILDRVDNAKTGEMLKALYTEIPDSHRKYARDCAAVLGDEVYTCVPYVDGCHPQCDGDPNEHLDELILNRTWRPQLAITGVDGIPSLKAGGNVLRKHTTVKLSIRLPPNKNPKEAALQFKEACEAKPLPFGGLVECTIDAHIGAGFMCPEYEPWLSAAMENASQAYFGKSAQFTGEGGSIPFMGELQSKYPDAQFVITGVLGPQSNAHGPNEFLHIGFCKNVICCISSILYDIGQYDATGEYSAQNNNNSEQKADN